jgi:hypothetical protein
MFQSTNELTTEYTQSITINKKTYSSVCHVENRHRQSNHQIGFLFMGWIVE